MKPLVLWLITSYRKWISPQFPSCCRFYPTCSAYALEAVSVHGVAKGLLLTANRLLRCHPFHRKNYPVFDPVPNKNKENN